MGSVLGVALLGAGRIAELAHLPAWQLHRHQAEVRVVVDRDAEKAEAVARHWDIPRWHTDLVAALAADDIDIADICLPPNLHTAAAEAALVADCHVLLEKPLARSLDEALKVRLLTQAYPHLTFMVAENWPYAPSAQRVYELLRTGQIGTPLHVRAHHESALCLPEVPPTPGWVYDADPFGGGYVLNAGTHTISLTRRFLGTCISAYCETQPVPGGDARHDCGALIILRFENGRSASLFFTGHSMHRGERRLGLRLFATQGVAELDIMTDQVVWSTPDQDVVEDADRTDFGYPEEIGHLLECIAHGTEPWTSVDDQVATHAVVEACYRSSENGTPIDPRSLVPPPDN